MPTLQFTPDEAPRLLRALASHDAELFDRACRAVRGLDVPREPEPDRGEPVHLLRAEG